MRFIAAIQVLAMTPALLFAVPAGAAQQQANTYAQGAQERPTIARLENGYVVVWASQDQDGSGYGVYGQRYSSNGLKAGEEFHISTRSAGDQIMPRVAGLSGGGFVVVWKGEVPGSGFDIHAAVFRAAGAKKGRDFTVTTSGGSFKPQVTALTNGGFVVVWEARGDQSSVNDVYAQLYDSGARPVGGEFRVNTVTQADQSWSAVGALADGGFVVVWASTFEDLDIFGQRYNAAGTPVGRQFRVNRRVSSSQVDPSVSGLSDGGFVVVWDGFEGTDANSDGSFGQRFTSTGAKVGGEFKVNTWSPLSQNSPRVSGFSDGGFVVVWESFQQDGSGWGVYGQVFDTSGAKTGGEFRLSSTALNDQRVPVVAAASAGAFMAAWTSPDQDGLGVFTRRFVKPLE